MASGWHRQDRNSPATQARRRKYHGLAHRAARAHYKTLVDYGLAHCWRCGVLLVPGCWHVGHDDDDTDVIRGAECVGCNRRAAALKGNRIARAIRHGRQFTRATR